MADWYVSSLAGGGGLGTIGSPFTFTEGVTFANTNPGWTAGDTLWIKADGVYNFTTQQLFTISGINTNHNKIYGYTSVIGDGGVAQLKRSSGAGNYVLAFTGAYWTKKNLDINGNSLCGGMQSNSGITYNCKFHHCSGIGFNSTGVSEILMFCESYINTSTGFHFGKFAKFCIAYSNSLNGFYGITYIDRCIASNNSNIGFSVSVLCTIVNSIAYANSNRGIEMLGSGTCTNCDISNMPSGIGINFVGSGDRGAIVSNVNIYSCTTPSNDITQISSYTTINPQYNNPAIRDFRRSGNNLSGIGFSSVDGFNYEQPIGISPSKINTFLTPTFSGITSLITASEGCLLASWSAGVNCSKYAVYIQPSTDVGLFTNSNIVFYTNGNTSRIKNLPNNNLLDYNTLYYVGVRGVNESGSDDGNIISISQIPSDNINIKIQDVINMIDDSHALILAG